MKRLEIGDRVRNISKDGPEGADGTVVMIIGAWEDDDPVVGIQYDESFYGGHDCSGQGPNYPIYKKGYCWWNSRSDLEFLEKGEEIKPEKWRKVGPGIKTAVFYTEMEAPKL